MTEGRQPFTAEIKTLAKRPSTYDPLENTIHQAAIPDRGPSNQTGSTKTERPYG
jgi:hypothetical protein